MRHEANCFNLCMGHPPNANISRSRYAPAFQMSTRTPYCLTADPDRTFPSLRENWIALPPSAAASVTAQLLVGAQPVVPELRLTVAIPSAVLWIA
jgi:hypothetical protein